MKRLLVGAGLVALVCVVLAILELTHVTNFIHRSPPTSKNGPTEEQKKQAAEIEAQQKRQAIENPDASTPVAPPTNDSISFSTQQLSNGTVTVFTNLGSVPNGSCELDVSNGSKTTSQTADVIYQTQYSTCAGFSVPISSVGTGNWTLTLKVTSGNTTASKTLSVEVT